MTMKRADFTAAVDLLAKPGTGPARQRRPSYADLLPPCNNACPAGEDIQAWLAHAQAGRYREAWLTLVRDNPLPAVHGRVCYHPCESHCNRAHIDSEVSIHAVERFLGDLAARERWQLPIDALPSGKRILVVGAGPSGLSAAYHLARMGHAVEIHDAGPLPGGMLHFGIPAYRLPRAELLNEVNAIEAMGVRIVLNHKVDDVLAEKEAGRFDAAFLAIGAQLGKRIEIPARDVSRMVTAVSLLRDAATGEAPKLGRRVVVYGAGNTAMDAARTAKRLGAEEALIVYRSDRSHMKAKAFEVQEAIEEGVKIKWLTSIKSFEGTDLTVEEMELGADGRPHPTGRLETLSADAVVLAVGQDAETGFLRRVPGIEFQSDGVVIVAANMMTGHPGIFAGGDMVPTERTVTAGVGHGKKAARNIDAWLRGAEYRSAPKHPVASFEMLHLPVYSDAERSAQSRRPVEERMRDFSEVHAGLDAKQATYEAKRCLSCGNCFECDQCYAACPEQAIAKLGPGLRYRYLYDRCTGCAVCFDTCPCHAIEMIPEPAGD
jgi:NADPH-dependent glutamate synthase beta subunit-like oxidoreductase